MNLEQTVLRAIVLICSVILTAQTAVGQIVVPTLVASQNLSTDAAIGASEGHLTDGSGLSSPVPSGATLASASTVTHAFGPTGEQQSWTTTSVLPALDYYSVAAVPVFVWDLGQDYAVKDIILWQYGNHGGGLNRDGNAARTFSLRFNTAAEATSFSGPAEFSGTMMRVWTTGGTNSAQTFTFPAVTARFVELTITDNYFAAPGVISGGDRVGFGEIRFNVTLATCQDVLSNSVNVIGGNGLTAVFLPRLRYTVVDAARLCGFDHFNWYQTIVSYTLAGIPLPYTGVDPKLGGNTWEKIACFPKPGGDDLPWYYNETPTGCAEIDNEFSLTSATAATTVTLRDDPNFGIPGYAAVFETYLVGVFADGSGRVLRDIDGAHFKWEVPPDGVWQGRRNCDDLAGAIARRRLGTSDGSRIHQQQ